MTEYNSKTNGKSTPTADNSPVQEKVEQVQQKASDVAGEVKQQASALTDQAKVEAKSSLESQKKMAVQELHGVAQALRQTGDNLREQDQTMFAQYSNQVADQVERASTYLEKHDLEGLVSEAEDFARRKPELFIGGAFTLGLLAARFMKSSAPSRENTRSRSFTDSQGYRESEARKTDDMTYTPYPDSVGRSPRSADDPRYNRVRS